MKTFDDALLELYKDGTITMEEAMSHADSRANLEAKVNFGG
jgi:twitching motility protein PilU